MNQLKNILLGAFSFTWLNTLAQNSALGQGNFSENYQHLGIDVFDANGKSFINPYVNIEGSAFFIENWKIGNIATVNSTVFNNLPLRLNLESQEVHFRKSNNIEMAAPAGSIKKITLFDTIGNQPLSYTFQCRFPGIDNQNENSFYQLLCDGEIKLLKSLKKSVRENKDGLSGEVHKEFTLYEHLYVFSGHTIQRLKKDKSFILDLLKDKKETIEQYATRENLSFKSAEDLKHIITYYNSLL